MQQAMIEASDSSERYRASPDRMGAIGVIAVVCAVLLVLAIQVDD